MRALRYTPDRSPKPRLTHPNQQGSRGSPLGRVLAGFVLASLTLCVFPGNAHAVNICNRTMKVKAAILAKLSMTDCALVTNTQLASITGSLTLRDQGITSLQADDFSGLSRLGILYLDNNDLSSLPPGVFSKLSSLKSLWLHDNTLSSLPPGVFSDLSSLELLFLYDNNLRSLRPGVFSNLSRLRGLSLKDNDLRSLPPGVFSNLSNLERLSLNDNDLRSLPPGVFSNLSRLEYLWLYNNTALSSLPPGVFSNLSRLETLYLHNNNLSSLPPGVFSNLSRLEYLWLHNNNLSSLPTGVFSNLSSLKYLLLHITEEVFTFTMEPERTGTNTFEVKVREGAPFTMTTTLSVSDGALPDGDTLGTVTVAAGSTTSDPITVTPTPGRTGPVVVTLGDPPSLPSNFGGIQILVGDPLTLTPAIQPRFRRLNNEILSKHALSIADVTIAAVTNRQEAGPRCAGQPNTGSLGGQSSLAEILRANAQTLNTGSLNLKQLLGTSAFRLRLTEDGAGPGCLTLWGQGDYRNLSSSDAQALEWDGDLVTGQVGADALLQPDLLAGLAVSWSEGDFDYTNRTEGEPFSGDYTSRMMSVHPYLTWWSPIGLDLWATGGYGQGEIEIKDEEAGTHSSDTTLRLGSVGASGPLFSESASGGGYHDPAAQGPGLAGPDGGGGSRLAPPRTDHRRPPAAAGLGRQP